VGWWTGKVQNLAQLLASRHHMPWVLSAGCCSIEIENAGLATYDWQRLGVDEAAESPSQSDLLIVAGWINHQRAEEIKSVYGMMRRPTSVLAIGACALSGSPYALPGTPASEPEKNPGAELIKASDLVPVDIFVPGCPPRPEALLDAILELQRKLNPGPHVQKVLHEAFRDPGSGY